jgi:hypothetical protein
MLKMVNGFGLITAHWPATTVDPCVASIAK